MRLQWFPPYRAFAINGSILSVPPRLEVGGECSLFSAVGPAMAARHLVTSARCPASTAGCSVSSAGRPVSSAARSASIAGCPALIAGRSATSAVGPVSTARRRASTAGRPAMTAAGSASTAEYYASTAGCPAFTVAIPVIPTSRIVWTLVGRGVPAEPRLTGTVRPTHNRQAIVQSSSAAGITIAAYAELRIGYAKTNLLVSDGVLSGGVRL